MDSMSIRSSQRCDGLQDREYRSVKGFLYGMRGRHYRAGEAESATDGFRQTTQTWLTHNPVDMYRAISSASSTDPGGQPHETRC